MSFIPLALGFNPDNNLQVINLPLTFLLKNYRFECWKEILSVFNVQDPFWEIRESSLLVLK